MPVQRSTEITPRQQPGTEATNFRARERAFASLYPVQPVAAGSQFPTTGLLGKGTYLGATLTSEVDVAGVPGATVAGAVLFDGSTGVVRDVTFEAAVRLTATANMLFLGCVFEVPVVVDSGGVVVMNGCFLYGTAAVTNAGAVGNANRVGCAGTSALAADANVTVTAGL